MTERQREMAVDFTESLHYLKRNFFKCSEVACLGEPEQDQAPEQEVAGVKRPKLFAEFNSPTEDQARGSSHEQEY